MTPSVTRCFWPTKSFPATRQGKANWKSRSSSKNCRKLSSLLGCFCHLPRWLALLLRECTFCSPRIIWKHLCGSATVDESNSSLTTCMITDGDQITFSLVLNWSGRAWMMTDLRFLCGRWRFWAEDEKEPKWRDQTDKKCREDGRWFQQAVINMAL